MMQQRHCSVHGWVATETGKCPFCDPEQASNLRVILSAIGLGMAIGLGTASVITWVF